MECFYRSKAFDEEGKPIKGYKKRMFSEWRERRMFESTEQRVCDQARAIKKNGWIQYWIQTELEAIKREVGGESQEELCREQDVAVDVKTVKIDARSVEEETKWCRR